MHNKSKKPIIVLICGGSCSGKTQFSSFFQNSIIVNLDNFYIGISKMKPKNGEYDFDSPSAINILECKKSIDMLINKGITEIPVFSMITGERTGKKTLKLKNDTKFIVIEGIFTFEKPLIDIADIKIFIDTPIELRIARRIKRDTQEKKRSVNQILRNSINVESKHRDKIEPQKSKADIIIKYSAKII